MKSLQSRVIVEGLVFPEGIRWHDGRVWFSDILDRKVCAHDPKTRRTEVIAETTDRPSGLGFLPDGRLLIATMGERHLLRRDPDGLTVVADLGAACMQMNDMVVDGHGRAYMDAMFTMERGGIILVEPNGASRVVVDDMKMPNGLAVTPDGKTLVANDLSANGIFAFDIAGDGTLSNRRVFAALGGDSPDGLCLDAEGAAWVGLPFQNKFRRIKPGGEVTHEIVYPNKWGVAPALGGPDRRTLFLCTAEITMEQIARLMQDPRGAAKECKGWIETVDRVDVAGAGFP